jgi:hypothetical protein
MKRSSILVLILSVCFVSAAWGQQARWSEFHRHNMQRLNPYENVLNVNNVGKPAAAYIPRLPWRMGWFTSARLTTTCTR